MRCIVQPKLRPLNNLNWSEINPFTNAGKKTFQDVKLMVNSKSQLDTKSNNDYRMKQNTTPKLAGSSHVSRMHKMCRNQENY